MSMMSEARHDDAPSAPQRLDVVSDDVRLAVYVSGPPDAPPLILVHGYPDSARVWEALRRELQTR